MQRTFFFKWITLSLLAAAAPAQAQWYAGAGIGATDARLDEGAQSAQQLSANGFSGAQTSLDKRDTGGRIYGGYRFHPNLAVEVGYADLGRFRVQSRANSGSLGAGELVNDTKIRGADISIVGRYRLNDKFSFLGRVGAFAAETESNASSDGSIVLFRDSSARYQQHKTVATVGLGGEYQLAAKVSLRGEWSRIEKAKTRDVLGFERDTSVNLYTIGVTYRF